MPLWGRGISSLYRRSVFKNLNKTVHTLVLIFNLPENVQIHCIQSVMHSLHPDFIRRCILLYLSFFFPFHRGIWILFAYLKCVNPYSLFKCQLNTFIITRITTKQRSMGCVLAILVCVGIIIPPPHLNIRWTIASVLLYPPDTVRVRDISSHIVREIIPYISCM